MSTSTEKIQAFTLALTNGPFDFDERVMNFVKQCINESGLDKPEIQVIESSSGVGAVNKPNKKALTGYNLYMKATMAELKEQKVPSNERMSRIGASWKALGVDGQQEWKEKAALEYPVTVTINTKGTKKGPKTMTGYQLFVKEQMSVVKMDKNIEPKARLAHIGQLWKALSTDQQGQWKVNAAKQ